MPQPTEPSARTPLDPSGDAEARTPVAATVVLARDGADGIEVLVMERPDRGSFAGAWVFPGGKLEEADGLADFDSEEEAARRAGVRETFEEVGLVVDPAELETLSCWVPPLGTPLRIRTWFFVAAAPAGALNLAPDEAVAAEWVRPADMLARHGRGEVTLYPPTWVTLDAVSAHPDVASLLGAVRLAEIDRFETVVRRGGEGPLLLWLGDAAYEDDGAVAEGEGLHRLDVGALPWRYTRSG